MGSTSPVSTAPAGTPLVSIVIPAHNAQDFLGDALGCLAWQGIDPALVQPVVIDDGSQDRTTEVAAAALAPFPTAVLTRVPAARGVSAARNLGLRAATGRFVTFLDADDWFAGGYLAHMVDVLEELDVDFVRTDLVRAAGKARRLWRAPVALRGKALATRDFIDSPVGFQATMVDFPSTLAGLYRRELAEHAEQAAAGCPGILYFDESLRTAEDREWNWRLFLADLRFAVVDSHAPVYRRKVSTSLTATYDERQMDIVPSCLGIIERCRADPDLDRFALKAGHNLLALVDIHLKRDDLPAHLRTTLVERTAGALTALRPAELDRLASGLGLQRSRRLAPVLTRVAGERQSIDRNKDAGASSEHHRKAA